MSDGFRNQVYQRMNQRETAELLQIWVENDRVEWTELALDVVRQILEERDTPIPQQNPPVFEHVEVEVEEEFPDADAAEMEDASAPVFYEPKKVLWLDRWINKIAVAYAVVTCVTSLMLIPYYRRIFWSYNPDNPAWEIASWVLAIVIVFLLTAVISAAAYFPLKALSAILRILMELEVNSRPEKQGDPTPQ